MSVAKNARARDASRGLSIYDGTIWAGTIIPGGSEFRAFGIAGRSLGVFNTMRSAMRAAPLSPNFPDVQRPVEAKGQPGNGLTGISGRPDAIEGR